MTVAIGMVVPGLVGYYLDGRLNTRALFTILGFGIGVTCGVWQLLRMASPPRDGGGETSSKT